MGEESVGCSGRWEWHVDRQSRNVKYDPERRRTIASRPMDAKGVAKSEARRRKNDVMLLGHSFHTFSHFYSIVFPASLKFMPYNIIKLCEYREQTIFRGDHTA
ncbi:hypothetical protein Trydic_g15824 [Trypoxylus dichotomus]